MPSPEPSAKVGLFAGAGFNNYASLLDDSAEGHASGGADLAWFGNSNDFLTSRTSHLLNLHGPSVNVQTACSTSLVAVHLACQSLLMHDSDVCLAGGVRVSLLQPGGYLFRTGGIRSPNGNCRPFDAMANGTVGGDGAGIVVLKRLQDALADNDRIYAVIKGSAVNNDGEDKIGFFAPSVSGQMRAVQSALEAAEVSAESIGLVETHGTATALGDPIEFGALTQAFRSETAARGFCALGVAKANVGHLDAAAGITGLIKAVLAIQHGVLPPHPSFARPNAEIELDTSPFFIPTAPVAWHAGARPRRAGVSSFGLGGTNAHVIVEQAPARNKSLSTARTTHLLLLSAKSRETLTAAGAELELLAKRTAAQAGNDAWPEDLAYSLAMGGAPFDCREAVLWTPGNQASRSDGGIEGTWQLIDKPPPLNSRHAQVAFLFPGQGSQFCGMALRLCKAEPAFKRELDLVCSLVNRLCGIDIAAQLLKRDSQSLSDSPKHAHLALFAFEHALSCLLSKLGVCPAILLGHSLGEYAAACQSGVFDLESCIRIVARRGELVASLPAGAMTSAILSPAEASELIQDLPLDLAVVNGPASVVLSGPPSYMSTLEQRLGVRGVKHQRLNVSRAYHSRMLDPVLDTFGEELSRHALGKPQIPFISNLSGTVATEKEARDPRYWVRHLRDCVQFSRGLDTLSKIGERVVMEIGAGTTLLNLYRANQLNSAGSVELQTVSAEAGDGPDDNFHRSVAALWCAGMPVNWGELFGPQNRNKVRLPEYPLRRERFWPASGTSGAPKNNAKSQSRHVEATRAGTEADDVAKGAQVADALLNIVGEALGITHISLDDNFFALGGHSIIGLSIISTIESRMDVTLQHADFYRCKNFRELAIIMAQKAHAGSLANSSDQRPQSAGIAPASFAHEWMLTWQEQAANIPIFNVPLGLRIYGDLNKPALSTALSRLALRNQSLHAGFSKGEDEYALHLRPEMVPAISELDLSTLPETAAEERLREAVRECVEGTFDLSSPPLWRVVLFDLPGREHLLLIVFHHIVIDGWSFGLTLDQLKSEYESACGGNQVENPSSRADLAEYTTRQRVELKSGRFDASMQYWSQELQDLACPEIGDLPRPATFSFRGDEVTFDLGPELSARVVAFCQEQRVTVYMLLLSAFLKQIAVTSSHDDVFVRTPFANRSSGTESLIGFLLHTIVIRVNLIGDLTDLALLGVVRDKVVNGMANGSAPPLAVLDARGKAAMPGRLTLFPYDFNHIEYAKRASTNWHNAQVTREPVQTPPLTKSDLSLTTFFTGDRIAGSLSYYADAISREQAIEFMAGMKSWISRIVLPQ
jgi:acyl transferase domain-containing protein